MTRILRSELAARIFGTPLFIHEGKAHAILAALGGRIVEGGVVFAGGIADELDHVAFEDGRPSLGRLGDQLGRKIDAQGGKAYDMLGNVAVIPIEGSLVHKGGYVGASSGRTSYQGLQTQVVRAARDPAVKGVAFEVDSMGGEAAGAFETAGMIRQLSQTKPTLAILTDHAFSAGYLLASQARQVIMPEMGGVGSIGAVSFHMDVSQKLANDGVRVTVLAAGAHKADGNSFAPLADNVKAEALNRLEAGRRMFADVVGQGRGSRFDAEQAMATEAASYQGADAVRLGLVDATGNAGDAFDAFVKTINSR